MRKLTLALLMILAASSIASCDQGRNSEMLSAPVGDGGFVVYATSGNPEGEPVLMIHGSAVAAAFLPIMNEPALSDYHLIRYHRRGYGGSSNADVGGIQREAEDARLLLEYLGIERVHVVGHSAGGPISVELARSQPHLVHSVTLLEGAVNSPLSQALEMFEVSAAEYPAFRNERLEQAKRRAAEASDIGDQMRSFVSRGLIPGAIEQATADLPNNWLSGQVSTEPVADGFYDDIRQPILYLISAEPPGWVEFASLGLVELVPGTVIRTLSDVPNHAFQMNFPEPTARAVTEWLAQHPFD